MASAEFVMLILSAAACCLDAQISCGDIDIVFAVHSSDSVSSSNFSAIRQFVVDVLDHFEIGQNKVRVGFVNYASEAKVEFDLTKHSNRQSAVDDVLSIAQLLQAENNTHLAVRKIREMCSGRLDDGVKPCVGVVVTHGPSGTPSETLTEVQKARLHGVKLVAIGVGSEPPESELQDIATGEGNTNVFPVDSANLLSALDLAQQIAQSACSRECDDVDLIFALDSSGSIDAVDFNKMLEFIGNVLNHLEIGQDKVRVGLVNYANQAKVEFNLTEHDSRQSAVDDITDTAHVGLGTNTHLAIREIREMCNGRQTSITKHCVGVVTTDGLSNEPTKTLNEALNTHLIGFELIAVGVGVTDQSELRDIASGANDTNVFTVDNASQLNVQAPRIAVAACSRGTNTTKRRR